MSRLSRLRPASLRGRVVLGVLALLFVLLVALFVTVDLLLAQRLRSDLRTRLTDRVALAEQLDGALSAQNLVDRLRGDGVSALLCSPQSQSQSARCVRADTAPSPPSGTRQPDRPGGGPPPRGRQPRPSTSTSIQSEGSVLFVQTTLPSSGQELTLSVDSTQVGDTLRGLILLELIGGVVALLVAALLLGRLVGTALRPLDHMTALARRIGAGDRGTRLGNGRPDTELGRTAAAFDDMLDELESALAAAAAAEARLRGFLSDVSHELRTPLTGLAATTETLLRDEPDRADRERAYVTLVRETRRANRLVDDLLTTTRLDTGMALSHERIDLVEIVRDEVERTSLLAPGLDVRSSGPAHAVVSGDAVRLGQVMTNLLENARTAAGADGRVDVTVGQEHGAFVVEVADSGPGVPDHDRERIFDSLVRLDESRARDRGGFGLGLPIARALARAHGGDLVCLPVQRGALFRLTVPAAD